MSALTAIRPAPRSAVRLPPLSGVTAVAFVALLVVVGLFGPTILAHEPNKISLTDRLIAPVGFGGSWRHPLGTDHLGRDVLARLIAGARISLIVALSSTVVAGTIGTLIGLLGGYFGGRLDRLSVWFGDVQMRSRSWSSRSVCPHHSTRPP